MLEVIDPFFVSRPSAIILDFILLFTSKDIFPHLGVTLYATLLGLALGSVSGLVLAFMLGKFRPLEKVLDPVIFALYGIPKLALGPLFILWFGLGIESKVVLSFIWVFFVMYFNAYGGFKDVDYRLINSIRLMGASEFQVITKVIFPSSLPWILTGLKSGVGVALLGTIVGEYIGSSVGLGNMVMYAGNMFNTTRVFSSILAMTLIMIILNELVRLLESRVLRWRTNSF
ncbi:MAG: ABC transporter permease [Peptococcaceae bacterium]|nr:ABC transporter permease [Candidatus Syntrophopropionicum ammoniitolerans]